MREALRRLREVGVLESARGRPTLGLTANAELLMSGGRERITATVPAPAERALLQVPRGVARPRVEREGVAAGEVIERRLTVVRGDRWTVVANWTTRGWSLGAIADPY